MQLLPYVIKIPTRTHNRASSVDIMNVLIVNIMHTIFKLHDKEVVIYLILVLFKIPDGLNLCLEAVIFQFISHDLIIKQV